MFKIIFTIQINVTYCDIATVFSESIVTICILSLPLPHVSKFLIILFFQASTFSYFSFPHQ